MTGMDDPVKELLFGYIGNSEQRFQQLAAGKRFDSIASEILEHCHDAAALLGDRTESLAVLATGMLHYLLTCSLLPSQRKVSLDDVDIDIVVPDMKTLRADPKRSLVLYVPRTDKPDMIRDALNRIYRAQPERQNVWLVLSEDIAHDGRTYLVRRIGGSFPKIIHDIGRFVNLHGQGRLRILRT